MRACVASMSNCVDGYRGSEQASGVMICATTTTGPKDHKNIKVPQTMISGIPPILGLGTRMSDPYVTLLYHAIL